MKHVMVYVITMMLAAPIYSQEQTGKSSDAKFPDANAFTNTKLTYKIINGANKTFGYDIYADGKLMIHQQNIPAMPGNNGFKTKTDAAKVAQLVIEKIKKGEMPPTVSIDEMKKLNVIE